MSDLPTKSGLRADLRRARRTLVPALARAEAAATVAALSIWLADRPGVALASYAALAGELDLAALHAPRWASGLPVWLPSVRGDALDWHPVTASTQLRRGAFAVPEPDPGQVPARALPASAVVLVPGLGFGSDGRRLGQGGGFYDRFLAAHRGPTIGIGFTCQRRDDLPLEAHDHPVAGVLLGGSWLRHPTEP